MVDRILLGYHNISYIINASIYLVKGGRLGLMPGVLFHSCRPSFRHTGVMFPDFAFLTRSGDLWDPLDSSLWIKLLQQGPTLVLPFASPPPIFPLGVINPRVIFITAPPGHCLSKCWSELEPFAAPPRETWGLVLVIRIAHPVLPWERDMCSSYRDCRRIGRLCWSCFTIAEMSYNRDSETDRVFPREGISFIDRESLWWAKLGHPCRV